MMMRSIGNTSKNINIFVPADKFEAEYLLKAIHQKNILENKKSFSYFRISKNSSHLIFNQNHFEKSDGLKKYDGLPEIIYLSKNILENNESHFNITIISCGPIIYNVLQAAKDLEKNNFAVTVINFSTINSSDENINNNIKNFLIKFPHNHKNILTVEEHSKIGGLGSLILETLSKEKVKIENLGIEDDLSPRNIVSTIENFASL
jgi:pyruvate/2-oxoglutarate/acetoin dehydrogenase E1 component